MKLPVYMINVGLKSLPAPEKNLNKQLEYFKNHFS